MCKKIKDKFGIVNNYSIHISKDGLFYPRRNSYPLYLGIGVIKEANVPVVDEFGNYMTRYAVKTKEEAESIIDQHILTLDLEKIYIAGKITGLEEEVYEKNFEVAENKLKELGYIKIVNPVKLCKDKGLTTWDECMLVCLKEVFSSDKLFVMDNWIRSQGAKIEVYTAEMLKKPLIYEYEVM
jgi:hypothetical protein